MFCRDTACPLQHNVTKNLSAHKLKTLCDTNPIHLNVLIELNTKIKEGNKLLLASTGKLTG